MPKIFALRDSLLSVQRSLSLEEPAEKLGFFDDSAPAVQPCREERHFSEEEPAFQVKVVQDEVEEEPHLEVVEEGEYCLRTRKPELTVQMACSFTSDACLSSPCPPATRAADGRTPICNGQTTESVLETTFGTELRRLGQVKGSPGGKGGETSQAIFGSL